jgi:hypothetical protein
MRLPRITTRRTMIVVAVVATAIWIYRLRERRRICSEGICCHGVLEESALFAADSPREAYIPCGTAWNSMTQEDKRRFFESLPSDAEYRAICCRDAAYHALAKQKLERANWRLWESFPDYPLDSPNRVRAGENAVSEMCSSPQVGL